MQYAQLLSLEQVEQVHDASVELLASFGIRVHNENAREIFKRHGCGVDTETHICGYCQYRISD